jgi:arylsulfatase A-like enzyme
MMRRGSGALGWLALVTGAVLAGTALAAPQGDPKGSAVAVERVLLITVDTLRADQIGAYGGPVPTPSMDRLAAEGTLVERAHTPSPSTGPAHASLMTGLHPWRHGSLRNAVALDPRLPTLAEAARGRGLATSAFVSSYILDRRFGYHQGFDHFVFDPTEEYTWRGKLRGRFWTRGEVTTRAAMSWLTENAERPFFLWVHYFDPHTPYRPPPGFALPPDSPIDLSGKRLPVSEGVTTPAKLKKMIRAYRGEVHYADAQVGRLVERLRLLGLLDETAVILTSDHGEGLGDHGRLQHGTNLFEELVRVPLILRGPGIPAGRRLEGGAQLEDLAPTILAWIGTDSLDGIDGKNLLPWLRGEVEGSPREAVLGQRRPEKNRRDQFFALRWPQKWIGGLAPPGLTFDLVANPREFRMRSEKDEGMPEVLRRSIEGATEVEARGIDPDPEVGRALKALGYAEE